MEVIKADALKPHLNVQLLKRMYLTRKVLIRIRILFLIGSLAVAAFRIATPCGCGPFYLVASFFRNSSLNTEEEYRFMNHGKVLGIKREIYDKYEGWAYKTLAIQFCLWLPSMLLLIKSEDEINWKENLYQIPSILIWILSEFPAGGL